MKVARMVPRPMASWRRRLTSVEPRLSWSWQYDLQMRVCYGIQDPIANPSAVLLQSIIDEAQECTYSLPTNHPYNTPTFQSILASGTDPLLSFVPGQAATVTSDEHGDDPQLPHTHTPSTH
jgi:hypothetical protein